MNYSFSPDGDDHKLTIRLYDAMRNTDKSLIDMAKFGLRNSQDESFRSTCVKYLASLRILSEQDVLVALSDIDEIVRIEGITASELIDSINIRKQLSLMVSEEPDEFIAAWAIATLGLKDECIENFISDASRKWCESEIVSCATSFCIALQQTSDYQILDLFKFINSDDHLVRGMVINLSSFFVDSQVSVEIEKILSNHAHVEEWESLKELLRLTLEDW